MYFVTLVSVLQWIIFYYFSTERVIGFLFSDPRRRNEVWRFLSPMFIHCGPIHLISNIGAQLVHGYMLRKLYSDRKIASIYLTGVLFGELAVAALKPWNYGYGASGGVYAITLANFMVTFINPRKQKFWKLRYIYVGFEASSIIWGSLAVFLFPDISHTAHLGGALGGILVALQLQKSIVSSRHRKQFQWLSPTLLKLFLVIGSVVTVGNIAVYGECKILDTNGAAAIYVREENSKSLWEDGISQLKTLDLLM